MQRSIDSLHEFKKEQLSKFTLQADTTQPSMEKTQIKVAHNNVNRSGFSSLPSFMEQTYSMEKIITTPKPKIVQ